MPASSRSTSSVLNLALQGGGAHGAFTWGALEALLDRPDIEIGRVSGTSAGALNGAALVTGLAKCGRQGAKDSLAQLWQKVAEVGAPMTFLLLPLRKPGLGVWDDALPLLSPYQANPVELAPLRHVLEHVVDLLASACAPLMFQAVQIDGESYWDGSYAGNPILWPLYKESLDTDILMIELTPLYRAETPTTAKNILNRINEIASINGLVSELRALDTLNGSVPDADIRLHVLSLPDAGSEIEIEPSIKRTVGPALFESLRRTGRAAGEKWLEAHRAQLGLHATVDVVGRYLAPYAQPESHP